VKGIADRALMDEKEVVKSLLQSLNLSQIHANNIHDNALTYIKKIRATPLSKVEAFMHQFSLSTEEGVAMMCLAEALLRIPDKKTAQLLVIEKLKDKNWQAHLGQSNSLFVNASTWGLLLSGKILAIDNYSKVASNLVNRLSAPVMVKALELAIKMLSNEFILGDNLPNAIKNAKEYFKKGYRISFDILGESARTQKQADFYYQEYIKALEAIAKIADKQQGIYSAPNLSIKLTALHPRVTLRQEGRVIKELLPKLIIIANKCKEIGITITFDAEEAYRQDIYLQVLTALHQQEGLRNFNGIGFVVQAYQKRALNIIEYIANLAKSLKKVIPIRLVKGAYWDGEIKHAQEYGLKGYPVFTRKEFTDVSYLACAQKILEHTDTLYPQFATHNAYTVAAIKELARGRYFEFQKLQGMGDSLHDILLNEGHNSRIYAPVGKYDDLLAYLMRRLLENGANTSFINLLGDVEVTDEKLVINPIAQAYELLKQPLKIVSPLDIYQPERSNSQGYELGYANKLEEVAHELAKFSKKSYEAVSIINGKKVYTADKKDIVKPAQPEVSIGKLYRFNKEQTSNALDFAADAFAKWSVVLPSKRAKIIKKFGELLHEHRFELYSLLMKEGGKNIDDAIAEVREAIDFANYYAFKGEEICVNRQMLPGYTGETNELTFHPRGVFVCISPWNFPLAIFCGQILAALVTGNTVLAKPAENTCLIATRAVELMLKAGIPKDALQLLVMPGKMLSELVLTDARVKGVCFTGSSLTAQNINRTLAARDSAIATFIAETGGQNAMLVDSSALLEQATDYIITSAFGSSGQRCSALRVLYIQEEIYQPLLDLLIGAMNELKIGDTEDLSVDLGPVISDFAKQELSEHIQEVKLIAAHKDKKTLEKNSGSYFVPHIVKINKIQDLSRENFGPILHVISYKAKNLDKVIEEINQTGYGLTFGLQTRLESRIHYVASRIKVGNFYANRTMIGAQVGTHPFGGENNSGTGFKAGGPYYLLKFLTERIKTINTTAIGGNLQLLT
jgi:RHH-type transcriptional regulator, proline utilization regulon repressor / proline dehydrogenase / delta 1-pyrroline-5-carboxylate dehydrogenase